MNLHNYMVFQFGTLVGAVGIELKSEALNKTHLLANGV